jgi:glycosyltransferase involved in cell wall biosynthesis
VVYIRAHFAALPTAALAKATGAIVIQEVNGPIEDAYDMWPELRRLDPVFRLTSRTQLRWADAIIAVTPGLATYVAQLGRRPMSCHVVGNGADVELFVPAGGSAPGRRPYVVFVGALASWQGIDTVMGAVASEAWPSAVDLVIAGDGKEGPRVDQAVRNGQRVQWLRTIPYAAVPALVAGSIGALVPMNDAPRSRLGLSPLKLFEAMACGVPVIASNLPGLGDIVRSTRCGLLFEAGEASELARCVANLAADPARARAMGARGRTAAVAEFSWDVRAGQTEKVLLGAASRHPHGGRSSGAGDARA